MSTSTLTTMPPRHKWAVGIAISIPLLACIYAFSLGRAPEKFLREFNTQSATAQDNAPLLQAGDEIFPLLATEITKKNIVRRRDVIAFLGVERVRLALPSLEIILGDESEDEAMRSAALEAISKIDSPRGKQLAALHSARSDLLGTSAKALMGL